MFKANDCLDIRRVEQIAGPKEQATEGKWTAPPLQKVQ
jgi:hypothetical protein